MFISFTMEFEWNERKNKINIQKHGLDFRTATRVFLDEKRLEIYDNHHSTFWEERYKVIGIVQRLIAVIITERNGKIRIISARVARKGEIDEYNNQNDIR